MNKERIWKQVSVIVISSSLMIYAPFVHAADMEDFEQDVIDDQNRTCIESDINLLTVLTEEILYEGKEFEISVIIADEATTIDDIFITIGEFEVRGF